MCRPKKGLDKDLLFEKYIELDANVQETAKFFNVSIASVYKYIFRIKRVYKLENLRTQTFEKLCDLVHSKNPSIQLKAIELVNRIVNDIKQEEGIKTKVDYSTIENILIE